MKTLLWLDDYRNPKHWMNEYGFYEEDLTSVIWVKTYEEFVSHIENNSLPDYVAFDHDLGTVKDGYDCAWWLVNYCMDNDKKLPKYVIQSANNVGTKNIDMLFKNFNKRIFLIC